MWAPGQIWTAYRVAELVHLHFREPTVLLSLAPGVAQALAFDLLTRAAEVIVAGRQ